MVQQQKNKFKSRGICAKKLNKLKLLWCASYWYWRPSASICNKVSINAIIVSFSLLHCSPCKIICKPHIVLCIYLTYFMSTMTISFLSWWKIIKDFWSKNVLSLYLFAEVLMWSTTMSLTNRFWTEYSIILVILNMDQKCWLVSSLSWVFA